MDAERLAIVGSLVQQQDQNLLILQKAITKSVKTAIKSIRSAPWSKSVMPNAQNAAISTLASLLNQRSLPLATVKPPLEQRWLQRCTAKATPVFSMFTHFMRCRNLVPFPFRSQWRLEILDNGKLQR